MSTIPIELFKALRYSNTIGIKWTRTIRTNRTNGDLYRYIYSAGKPRLGSLRVGTSNGHLAIAHSHRFTTPSTYPWETINFFRSFLTLLFGYILDGRNFQINIFFYLNWKLESICRYGAPTAIDSCLDIHLFCFFVRGTPIDLVPGDAVIVNSEKTWKWRRVDFWWSSYPCSWGFLS